MLAPWEVLDAVSQLLVTSGVLMVYVATVTQLSRSWRHCGPSSAGPGSEPGRRCSRGWNVVGLAVGRGIRCAGATAFLVTAGWRRGLAPAPLDHSARDATRVASTAGASPT